MALRGISAGGNPAGGQTNLEYVLLVIVAGLAVLFAAARFGGALREKWCEAALAVQSVRIIGSFVPEEPAGCSVDVAAVDGAAPLAELGAPPPLPNLEPILCKIDRHGVSRSSFDFRFQPAPGATLETGPDNTCPGEISVASGHVVYFGDIDHFGEAGSCVADVIYCIPDEGCSEARLPVAFGPDRPSHVRECP